MKIRGYFVLIALSLLLSVGKLFAQGGGTGGSSAAPVTLPNVIQPPPEAAALGKYGDQVIGLNSGTAMAKIPLYELKTKNLSLPIGISYASNGVRVDESASRVGMSWVLNAGGVITRTVYDKPDLSSHPRMTAPPNLNFHLYNPQMNSTNISLYTTDTNLLSWLETNIANPPDMQYDEFNFNFNGYAGKFIFDNNNNIILLPQSNLKVEYQSSGNPWTFRITTPDGIRYYFGGNAATETTTSSTGYSNHDSYNSAWYLYRMESVSDPSDYITLNYQRTSYGYFTGVSENISVSPYSQLAPYYNDPSRVYAASNEVNANLSGLGVPIFTLQNVGTGGVCLQSISASHYGTVKFSYQGKPDAIGADSLLQKIEVDLASGQPSFYYNLNYNIVSPNSTYYNAASTYYSAGYFNTAQGLARPFLKNVVKSAVNTPETQTYSFQYIDINNLPPHLAFCQDHWGYFNGKTNLNSLIFPGEGDYLLLGSTLIGNLNANRDVDYSYTQKGMLSQITYPTGGSTQFVYEGNSLDGTTPTSQTGGSTNLPVIVNNLTVNTSTPSMTFSVATPTTVNLAMEISCNCPTGGCAAVPNSTIAVQLVMNGTTNIASFDFTAYNTRGDCAKSSGGTYTLQPGSYGLGIISNSPYTITASITNSGNTGGFNISSSQISGNPTPPAYVPLNGGFFGGVRVKQLIDTDPVTGQTKTTNYLYSGMAGSYVPSYEVPIYKYGLGSLPVADGGGPITAYTNMPMPLDYAQFIQFSTGTTTNLVGRNSHSLNYTNVTEKFGNNFEDGGIDHTYSFDMSVPLVTTYGGHITPNVSPPELFWRNGLELTRNTYKYVNNVKVPVQNIVNSYTVDPRIINTYEQFIIKDNNTTNIFGCITFPDFVYTDNSPQRIVTGCSTAFFSDAFAYNKRESVFDVYSITTKQEWQYLAQTQTTNYDLNGQNPITTTESYYYDNPAHVQLTRKVTTNSDSKVLTSLTTYPDDYPAGTQFIDDMKSNHLTGLPVESVNYETAGTVTSILSGKVNQYQTGGAGLINQLYIMETASPVPLANFKFSDAVSGSLPSQGVGSAYSYDTRYYVPRVSYTYNTSGDLTKASLTNGPPVAYQWGYNNQYPVAKATNAANNDIFYDSFEEGDGNTSDQDSKTGHYSYNGIATAYAKALSGLDPGTYTLSWWLKSGSSWTLQTQQITVSGSTYTINLSGQIDDVRFYPTNAMMTTYTYDPLVGLTSIADPKCEITYYEYDSFKRLMNIRDKDKNIIKSYCYNYAGQANGCFVNLPSFQNDAEQGTFTTNCGIGYTGSQVTYVVPSGKYISNISVQDADNKALADVQANGQNYANATGMCTANPISFTLTNSTGVSGFVASFSVGSTVYNYNFLTSGSTVVQVPPGVYTVTINPINAPTNRKFLLGSRAPVTAPGTTFTNVSVTANNSESPLIIQNP